MDSHKVRHRCFSIILILVMVISSACAGKAEEKTPLTADKNPKSVIEAANRQYKSERVRGSKFTYIYTYTDDSKQEESGSTSFDVDKGIQQLSYLDGEEVTVYSYNVKDGDRFYTYILDPDTNAWLRYEQTEDEKGMTTYEYQEEGKVFYFNEENGYTNVEYSNEGEEEIDGVTAIKIKETGELPSGNEETTEEITRESILSDYELTEEAVGYIDGLSEALDRYVAAMNSSGNTEPEKYESYLWVDAVTHRPIQSKTIITLGNTDTSESTEDMAEFEDNSWKAYSVKEDLDNGLTVEEALEKIKENEKEMEAEIEAEKELLAGEDMGDPEYSDQKMLEMIEYYVYGDMCDTIGELPESYTEITQEEYYYGEY